MRLSPSLLAPLLLLACDGGRARDPGPTIPATPICGDGRIQEGERCDGTALGGATCGALRFEAGTLGCTADCAALDPSACGAPASCGDGLRNPPEVCDGVELGGATCASRGLGDGTLGCLASCGGFDTSRCGPPVGCGNGARDGVEACDGDDFGGLTCAALRLGSGPLGCSADCRTVDTSGCRAPADAGVIAPSDGGTSPAPVDGGPGDPCAGQTCSGHGLCAVAMGRALCVCDQGYDASGLTCVARATGAPVIAMVVPSVARLTEGEAVRLTATVSDPDGLADIGGGRAESTGGQRLATFTAIGAGTYEATVTWSDLLAAGVPDFVGQATVDVVVVFFDGGGHDTRSTVPLQLHCGASGGTCGGACTALDTDAQCGGCNLGCGQLDAVHQWPGQCERPGTCRYEAAINDAEDATPCRTACGRLFPDAVCTGSSSHLYLGFRDVAGTCDARATDRFATRVQLSDVTCSCRAPGAISDTILPKTAQRTCAQTCAMSAGAPCSLTNYQGTIVATGESVFGADWCQAPYIRANFDSVAAGATITIDDTVSNLSCWCERAAR